MPLQFLQKQHCTVSVVKVSLHQQVKSASFKQSSFNRTFGRIWCLEIIDSLVDFHSTGEESLTIFLDKQKLNKKSEGNRNSSVVSLELLHQLAASYFTDRESTLRRLHHLQIATSAIKVLCVHVVCFSALMKNVWYTTRTGDCICKCLFPFPNKKPKIHNH